MRKLVEAKVYLPRDLVRALDQLAARTRRPRSELIRAAVASFLSADGPDRLEAALGRRLDRLSRQLDRLERDVTISNEAHGLFVRTWLDSTPALPESGRAAAEARGRERYLRFIETIGRRVAAGQSLAREVLEDRLEPQSD